MILTLVLFIYADCNLNWYLLKESENKAPTD